MRWQRVCWPRFAAAAFVVVGMAGLVGGVQAAQPAASVPAPDRVEVVQRLSELLVLVRVTSADAPVSREGELWLIGGCRYHEGVMHRLWPSTESAAQPGAKPVFETEEGYAWHGFSKRPLDQRIDRVCHALGYD